MNGSFIVEVKSQENHTWEGCIVWVNRQEKKPFHSVLEMLKLMYSALREDN